MSISLIIDSTLNNTLYHTTVYYIVYLYPRISISHTIIYQHSHIIIYQHGGGYPRGRGDVIPYSGNKLQETHTASYTQYVLTDTEIISIMQHQGIQGNLLHRIILTGSSIFIACLPGFPAAFYSTSALHQPLSVLNYDFGSESASGRGSSLFSSKSS